MISLITQAFQSHFSTSPLIAFAPGRINLIGEHTDYQEGFVFPAAVEQGIWVGIQKNDLPICRLHSLDFEEEFIFELESFSPKKGHWATYVMGMVALLKQAGYPVQGFDMVIGGDIPVGSGLSSSAALSVSIGTAISGLFGFQISKKSIALYGQKSEHLFAGVNCGIMDQYASAFGVKGKALLLDCRSTSHEEIPAEFGDYALVLVNSKVKHTLADTAYNKRRRACEESVRILSSHFKGICTLRDIDLTALDQVEKLLPSELFPKAKHQITENSRVHQAGKALKSGELETFGELLKDSHRSLSQDYEVSCVELDFLAEKSWEIDGVLGSRMMGGGFGGCTINLVKDTAIPAFEADIARAYLEKFNINPDFILVKIGSGTSMV